LLLYISSRQSVVFFAIGICLVGFCFGSFLGIFPGFTADRFGISNNSVNYGIMFLGFSVGSLTGPSLIHLVRQKTGSYQAAFLISAALVLCGLFLTLLYRKIERD
ncbi:MAG: MFS transporter, partial [Clostridiales bacterium]|nr:MFS transporter [Clostridiales bacterium]